MTHKSSSWESLPQPETEAGQDEYLFDEETQANGSPTPTPLAEPQTVEQPLEMPVLTAPRRRSPGRLLLWGLLLLAAGGAGYWTIQSVFSGESNDYSHLVTETVQRGPFAISVTDNGELDSLKNVTLSSRVEEETTILSIIPEGTMVRAPLLSELEGEVTAIQVRGESERIITVRSEPLAVRIPGLFLYAEPETVDHYADLGEYTKLAVSVGEKVEKGDFLAADVVCELDSTQFREEAKQQKIDLTQAIAALQQAAENLEIQRAQNESDIAAAELLVELSALDLEKYTEGEFLQLQNEIKGEITLAREDLTRAVENYEFSKRIAKKGYRTQSELETARIAVTKAEIARNVAMEKLKVLEEYTWKRTVAELSANAEETKRGLDRVKRKAASMLSQFQSDYEACKLTAEVQQSKYDRLLQQIDLCTLRAPQDGEVVYEKPNSRSRNPFTVEEGATVRERQAIVKLPDMTQMKVEAGIHESRISLVQVGLPVRVRIDAYHSEVFHGVVDSVSTVPTSGRWPNTDLKEYPTVILLTDSQEKFSRLKPGLTAQVEIMVRQRSNVLQVPVQAVVTVGQRRVAFVLGKNGPERRDVKVGEASDVAVEILDGVAESERVVMNPRTHFADELQELEDKANAKQKQNRAKAAGARPAAAEAAQSSAPRDDSPEKRPAGGGDPAAFFTRLDGDGDGKIRLEEVPGPMKSRFAAIDANGDGGIDAGEFAAAARNRPQ